MKRGDIGGQAVLEGVMLRSPRFEAVAVRAANGKIMTWRAPVTSLTTKKGFFGLPLIRGIVALYESLRSAISSLTLSVNLVEPEENISSGQMVLATMIALALGIGLFFLLPTVLVAPLAGKLGPGSINLLEGLVRVLIFVGYLSVVGLSKDIRRTFAYHGAEHKVIMCWEEGKPLNVESAATCSRFHPRCGTSFLLLVVVLSIVIFSFFSPPNLLAKLGLRLALLPLLTGLSYELIRWTAKSSSPVARVLLTPGLLLQKLTTREPDSGQLEVALAALAAVIDRDEE
ncbi:MAG: DUF1385 domain-containing protein [Bacillota bacterium]